MRNHKIKLLPIASFVLLLSTIWTACTSINPSASAVKTFEKQIENNDIDLPAETLDVSLKPVDAEKAADLYMGYLDQQDSELLKKEWADTTYTFDKYVMPVKVRYFKPTEGAKSLIISLHGGGSTTKEANDQQWRNQIALYNNMSNAVYVAPRAAVDAWNMWHQSHVDELLTKIIRSYVLFDQVDPNRVYITGYSAGGDGVYQLAPRMSDRLAGADMNAGHPNEVTPLGLRNLPFALFMGAEDAAYHRNDIARKWRVSLDSLQDLDPNGYTHYVDVVPGKGHWMDHKDSLALDWMVKYRRAINPNRVVWIQDDVKYASSYWLATDVKSSKAGDMADVVKEGNTFTVKDSSFKTLYIQYSPTSIDPNKPIEVIYNGKKKSYEPTFTLRHLINTANNTHDAELIYMGRIEVK
ncbi:hypothetical protein K5X82_16620 [Halosquirtibacter xylanolyticus]|uniref:hypothetical protein n=1 Tax=Halosquirtibacter xylanolyticus TaxID=3374599 RepID=UPI0037489C5B|nr:hypothetical protein K5X82_16620 [Prolixibacteraceae bacterium]